MTDKDQLRQEAISNFEKLAFEQIETSHEEIFKYFTHRDRENIIYKLVFYEGFRVYAINERELYNP